MSRLIFFSGGVESTALLCEADPMDKVVVIDATYPFGRNTYSKDSVEKIAEKLGFQVNYAAIKIPFEPDPYQFVHQFASFIAVAHLWVVKDPSITEVWAGRNRSEVPAVRDPTNFKTQQLMAWEVMHPDIPFRHPLEHLSKYEHWQAIPADIQPLVSTCIWQRNCGECAKCLEFKRMFSER